MATDKKKEAADFKGREITVDCAAAEEVNDLEESASSPVWSSPLINKSGSSMTMTTTPSNSNSSSAYEYEEDKEHNSPASDKVSEESAVAEVLMYKDRTLEHYCSDENLHIWAPHEAFKKDYNAEEKIDAVVKLARRSAYLIVTRYWRGICISAAGSFCQAALVEDHDGVKWIVTAKHGFRNKEVGGKDCHVGATVFGLPKIEDVAPIPSPTADQLGGPSPVNLRQSVTWPHGIDILSLPSPEGEGYEAVFSNLIDSFTMVRQDFRVQAEQKIGIVVYNRYAVNTTCKAVQRSDYKNDENMTDEKLSRIFGAPNTVAIHVGEISYVGQHYIEYGLNSTNGYSGAIVFLLDVEGQPVSVRDEDRGKAIAVHAGFTPGLGTNIAFPFSFLELEESRSTSLDN